MYWAMLYALCSMLYALCSIYPLYILPRPPVGASGFFRGQKKKRFCLLFLPLVCVYVFCLLVPCLQRRTRGERRLPDAWAGTEVDSVSKIVIENLEQIDKSPPKWQQTRDPETRGQIPKRARCPPGTAVRLYTQLGEKTLDHSGSDVIFPSRSYFR
jgi:hypothetical protein